MKRTIAFLLLVTSALLFGCAIRPPNISPNEVPEKGTGLFVSTISLWDGQSNVANGQTVLLTLIDQRNLTKASAILPIEPGASFRVFALPAGKYSLRGLYIGHYYSEFRGKLLFEIKENVASYVGDIDIVLDRSSMKYDLKIVDRNGVASTQYASDFPASAQMLPLTIDLIKDLRHSN